MLRIGIIGASGYTGVELARILANHPNVTLSLATSRKFEGQSLAEIFPNLRSRVDICCENPSADELADKADFFFAAVPHKTAMDIVPKLLDAGKKVVDLSADYRIKKSEVYERWYQEHSSAHLLTEAVYGLPELYRKDISTARLTANPGCYPTSVILGLAPLLKNKQIDTDSIIIDSKSGTTGAGRSLNLGSLFCEVNDGFRPYKVGGSHRHIPEIEQELSLLADKELKVSFTPHLLPISRGILSTIYATDLLNMPLEELQFMFEEYYRDEAFVRVLPAGALPATQYVRGSNCCDIAIQKDSRTNRIIVLSAIDNIVKGASGQAVQNMNLMNGFAEDAGLLQLPVFP